MWKNCRPGQATVTIKRKRIACWIPKATHAHSGYVILVVFRPQKWLQKCAWMLRHTYFAFRFSIWAQELLEIYGWDLTCRLLYTTRGHSQIPLLYILQTVMTIRRTQVGGKESPCGERNHWKAANEKGIYHYDLCILGKQAVSSEDRWNFYLVITNGKFWYKRSTDFMFYSQEINFVRGKQWLFKIHQHFLTSPVKCIFLYSQTREVIPSTAYVRRAYLTTMTHVHFATSTFAYEKQNYSIP